MTGDTLYKCFGFVRRLGNSSLYLDQRVLLVVEVFSKAGGATKQSTLIYRHESICPIYAILHSDDICAVPNVFSTCFTVHNLVRRVAFI